MALVVSWLVWFDLSVSLLAGLFCFVLCFVVHTELLSECGYLFTRGLAAGLVSVELAALPECRGWCYVLLNVLLAVFYFIIHRSIVYIGV